MSLWCRCLYILLSSVYGMVECTIVLLEKVQNVEKVQFSWLLHTYNGCWSSLWLGSSAPGKYYFTASPASRCIAATPRAPAPRRTRTLWCWSTTKPRTHIRVNQRDVARYWISLMCPLGDSDKCSKLNRWLNCEFHQQFDNYIFESRCYSWSIRQPGWCAHWHITSGDVVKMAERALTALIRSLVFPLVFAFSFRVFHFASCSVCVIEPT